MSAPIVFVTGTDTGVGKTHVTAALLRAAGALGVRAAALKPIASGAERDARGELRWEDVESALEAAPVRLAREQVNLYRFEPPIAPHLAAAQAGVALDLARIVASAREAAQGLELLLVEGAGGWLVPLDERRYFADLALELRAPVLLVVGMRLGCINHALLSVESITARGLPLAGWIANHIDPGMLCPDENLDSLRQRIAAPLLGRFEYASAPGAAARHALRALLARVAGARPGAENEA
jgi:dethiobiotin synthetase